MNKFPRLEITGVVYGGDGIGKLASGKVCFVPGTLPGETVEVEIIQEKRGFCRGVLRKVVIPSGERIDIACPVFVAGCPGCAYMHCSYAAELQWKQQQLEDFFIRAALADKSHFLPPYGAPERFGTRNKLKLSSNGSSFAMYGRDNISLLPVKRCLLADEKINSAVAAANVPAAGIQQVWRSTARDGVVSYENGKPQKQRNWLTEELPGIGCFKVPVDGFFQTNIAVAGAMVEYVTGHIAGIAPESLTELYCGTGVFSIAAALKLPELRTFGIELDRHAIKAAKWNCVRYQLGDRCRFRAGDAAGINGNEIPAPGGMLLVDPPRSGLSGKAVEAVMKSDFQHLVYISCAADTLRRDLQTLCREQWVIESIRLFDMFPATAHFETVAFLKRR